MGGHKFKKEMSNCMIHNCYGKIPSDYPLIAKFCQKHTCSYSTDSYIAFCGGLFNDRKPKLYTSEYISNKIMYECYQNNISDNSTTCKDHTCEFKGCLKGILKYSTNCKDHQYKMTKKDNLLMLCVIVLFFLYVFRFLYFIR